MAIFISAIPVFGVLFRFLGIIQGKKFKTQNQIIFSKKGNFSHLSRIFQKKPYFFRCASMAEEIFRPPVFADASF